MIQRSLSTSPVRARAKEEPKDLGFIMEIVLECITLNEPLLELLTGQQLPQRTSETGETLGRASSIIQWNFKNRNPHNRIKQHQPTGAKA